MRLPSNPVDNKRIPTTILAVLMSVAWIVCFGISQTAPWKGLELRLLDHLSVLSAPQKSKFPITVVGIDEESFAKIGKQWPWPRRLHADAVERLTDAGAAMIVFDVLFAEPSGKDDDQRLVKAIQRAGNVVLVADRIYRESASVRQWLRIDPAPMFTDAGAAVGLATVALDPDLVIRQIPDAGDSLWRAVVLRLLRDYPEINPNLRIAKGSYIRYVGSDHTFPYVSYHEILQPDGSLPADFFKDQVVIIGRDVKASPDIESAQADLFATPFTASTGWLSPGAEVHANIIETVLGGHAIVRASDEWGGALIAAIALVSGLAMRRWRPLVSAIGGLILVAATCGVVFGAFIKWDIWIPAGAAVMVIPLMYVGAGGWSFVTEQVRRKELTRAFSLYVTPQVVAQLIDHPERLSLQGELRNITIMFTDLAGFTSFSEQLSPEQVTQLLNRHFSEMTDVVLEYHGTVVRFIGDAVMAFWGAPLDDDDQAYRAVTAGIAMQNAMALQREAFIAEGLPAVNMRVGIHSGCAIVGNLGSKKRFDYTAIGDDVNLAARLEGINKLYGTGIMISGETASRIEGRCSLRPIDRVIVKGRSTPIDVFTPCDDAELIELTTQMLDRFRHRDWDAATSALDNMLARTPDDQVSKLYTARIAEFRNNPPPSQWDGSFSLDKL
jgi:adenylate cyclase